MNYKLLATDFDDTLLSDNFTVSKENSLALLKAKEAGIIISIVTGREYAAFKEYWDKLSFGDYGVILGGSQIAKRDGTIIDHRYLKEDILEQTYDYIKKKDLYFQVFTGFSYYYNREDQKHDVYSQITKNYGKIKEDIFSIKKDIGKIIIIADEENVKDMSKELSEKFKDKAHVIISKPTYIEISDIEATKGNALLRLISILGIKKEETIAIGDGPIDISMIKEAGLGIAVSNAVEELKAQADYISPSNNENAIAHVIYKYINEV